jgi:homoserine kinase type II
VLIGETLARVHRELRGVEPASAARFHGIDVAAGHLAVRPWVRPAVAAAVRALDALDPATLIWGLLHTDPAPEAFRQAPGSRVCGVIDWSVAMSGPLLYDLASAVMYVGGAGAAAPLIEAYLATAPVPAAEIHRGLATMVRFRWAVQADYFARRVADGDLTGITGPADNERGLADARRHLAYRAAPGFHVGGGG